MSATIVFSRKDYDKALDPNSGLVFNPVTGKLIGIDEKAELFEDFIESAERALIIFSTGSDVDDFEEFSDLSNRQRILTKCCTYVLNDNDYYIKDFNDDEIIEFLDLNVFPPVDSIFDSTSGERDIQYFTDTTNTKMVLLTLLCDEEYDAGILFNFYSEGV